MYITPFAYNKETSKILKGIAILMMVFLHLFNRDSQIDLYDSCFFINGHPLAQCFARACNPVGMFLFLSGYGMFYSFKRKNPLGGVKRVVSLYLGLWVTYAIFIPICSLCINDNKYPGTFLECMSNFFAYTNSWNHTTWFILPFALIIISSTYLFSMMKTTKHVSIVFIISLMLYYCVAIIYGKYWSQLQNIRIALIICRYFEQLCPFLLGALTCFHSYIKVPCKLSSMIIQVFVLLLIVLCFGYSTLHGIPVYPIYSGVLMVLFANLKYKRGVADFLTFLGCHSMTIWLIHIYFCDELLKSFIYGLRTPVLIFLMEMIISISVAIIIDRIFNPYKVKLLNLIK